MPARVKEPPAVSQNRIRCKWSGSDPLMIRYHDEEWGVPEYDSRALWEMLMLEGFQAGLSWITILRKREAFRAAFRQFDPAKVARFAEERHCPPAPGSRHHSVARKDRGHHSGSAHLPRYAESRYRFLSVGMGPGRRQADSEY